MTPLANIVSRSEALVIASMLEAAGIIVRINGEAHVSVEVNSVALGGYLLTVPDWQHADASKILGETFAALPVVFSTGLRSAIFKLLLAKIASCWLVSGLTIFALGNGSFWIFVIPFGWLLDTPVNPQGRSEYYLAAEPI
jgi:hypothetical protein